MRKVFYGKMGAEPRFGFLAARLGALIQSNIISYSIVRNNMVEYGKP